jgi:hypothetical protein
MDLQLSVSVLCLCHRARGLPSDVIADMGSTNCGCTNCGCTSCGCTDLGCRGWDWGGCCSKGADGPILDAIVDIIVARACRCIAAECLSSIDAK